MRARTRPAESEVATTVEYLGLENRHPRKRIVGSNPPSPPHTSIRSHSRLSDWIAATIGLTSDYVKGEPGRSMGPSSYSKSRLNPARDGHGSLENSTFGGIRVIGRTPHHDDW